MKNPLHILTALILIAGMSLSFPCRAQSAPDTVRLSANVFLRSQGVDSTLVADTASFRLRLENLKEPYAQRIDTCSRYQRLLSHAITALDKSGTPQDSLLWIDSTSCYYDYGQVRQRLETCLNAATRLLATYQSLEQQRVEKDRRAAEERARMEAKRKQDELNKEWNRLKAQVMDQHTQIESILLAAGVTDKNKVKALKDLRFNYLPIYNNFDLSPVVGDEQSITRVQRLQRFQRHLLDSVLGPSGYPAQIEAFPTTLKIRSGKPHADLYKSYVRVFKSVSVPNSFGKLEEYRAFVQRLRDIRSVQQGYITAIELREQISNNTMALQNACGKRRKELYDAYSLVLAGFNQVPIFTTPGDRDMFIESLQDFILVQEQYLRSVNRLDDLQLRGDSITAVCAKRLNDVGDAYRTLAANASFIPTFTTLAGADFFFNSLDDFEQIQQDFIRTIALRNAIALKADSITSCKGAPRELVAFYKDLQARTLLTPTFNHHDKALVYLQQLEVFINLQDHVLEGEMQAKAIEGNSMLIKSRSKNLQNIWKAYQSLLKAYEPASTVRTENDLTRYLSSQRALIDMQQVVYGIIDGPDREVVNIRLKGEKDLTMMKATMGIK